MNKIFRSVLFSLLAVQLLYILLGLINNPFATGDAYSIWFLKAKALTFSHWSTGFIDFLKNPFYGYSHPEYPLLWPFILSIWGLCFQYIWLYPLLLVGCLFLVYKIISKYLSKNIALLGCFLLSSVVIVERMSGVNEVGFADLPLALGYLSIFFVFIKYDSPLLLGVTLALTSLIKMEGAIGVILFLYLFRPKQLRVYFISLTPIIVWFILTKIWGLNNVYENTFNVGYFMAHVNNIVVIGKQLIGEVFDLRRYGFWIIIFLLTFLKLPKNILLRKMGWWVGGYLFLISLSYVFTPLDISSHWATSFYRIVGQIMPLMLIFGMFNLGGRRELN